MRAIGGPPAHIEHMKMRWGDMDALGHMNNAVYFRYFEQARISWFDRLTPGCAAHAEGPILGSIRCRFRLPVVYPANLAVAVRAGKPRNSSFVLESVISDEGDAPRIYATSEAVMVWVDLAAGKSRPLPDWFRKRLQQ